ncbi:MAG: hypothetical protein R3C53_08130 [Pirellulaceae bacterium]
MTGPGVMRVDPSPNLVIGGPLVETFTQTEQAETRPLVLTRLLAVLAVVACGVVYAWPGIPLWIQPTAVGAVWAGLFVAGFVLGGLRRGNMVALLAMLACSWVFESCFQALTHLATADCVLISTLLFGSGWLTARVDLGALVDSLPGRLRQWSIADLVVVTTISACLAHSLSNLTTPSILLFSVLTALVAGSACSVLAYRWVWNDHFSFGRCAMAVGTLALLAGYLYSYAPVDMTILDAVAWALTGPVNVVAAQGVTVLVALSLLRFDASNAIPVMENNHVGHDFQ